MIAACNPAITPAPTRSNSHADPTIDFVSLLPQIRRQAFFRFSSLDLEAREEAVAEAVARAYVSYRRLQEQGKADKIAVTPLVRYAVRQVCGGRLVGGHANVRDISSLLCRKRNQLRAISIDQLDEDSDEWQEVLVEDRRTTPADIAITRIDFRTWLAQLPARLRQIAEVLATGETSSEASTRFGVSRARISQIRSELKNAWLAFQGELSEPMVAAI